MFRIFCLTLCLIAIVFGGRATASCVRPEIGQFLEESRNAIQFEGSYFPSPKARFLPSKIDGLDVQWVGASWEGPVSGAIFLLDCRGKMIASANIGAVQKLGFGPVLQGKQAVEITYVPGTAAGESYVNVALALLDGTSIKMLWDHRVSDAVAMLSVGAEYDDRFQWEYSADGQKIEVTGRRKVGSVKDSEHGWPARTIHALPNEAYCWDSMAVKFGQCR